MSNNYIAWNIDHVSNQDSKVHGVNMGPTCVLSALDGPHVGPMNLAIMEAKAHSKAQQSKKKG